MEAVWTDPGCEAETHRLEVLGASVAWDAGYRFPFPALMDCGCRIVWIGDSEPPNWGEAS